MKTTIKHIPEDILSIFSHEEFTKFFTDVCSRLKMLDKKLALKIFLNKKIFLATARSLLPTLF